MLLFSIFRTLFGSTRCSAIITLLNLLIISSVSRAEDLVGHAQNLTDTPLAPMQAPSVETSLDDETPTLDVQPATPKMGPPIPIAPIIHVTPVALPSIKIAPQKIVTPATEKVINVLPLATNPLKNQVNSNNRSTPTHQPISIAAPKKQQPIVIQEQSNKPTYTTVAPSSYHPSRNISTNSAENFLAPNKPVRKTRLEVSSPIALATIAPQTAKIAQEESSSSTSNSPVTPAQTTLVITPLEVPVKPPKKVLNPPNCPAGWEKEICVYANLINFVKRQYAYDIDTSVFLKEATKRAIGSLDRHAQYFDPEGFKELLDSRHGDFAGVGITVGSENGVLRIHDVFEDGPSSKAGIKVNDLITEINGKALSPLTFKEAIKLLRGQPKSEVVVTVVRPPQNKVLRLKIVRDIIVTSKIKHRIFKDDYAWIRVPGFTDRTLPQLAEALKAIEKERTNKNRPPIKGLVLDVRQNGGGGLQTAVGVAAAFLPPDVAVTKIISRDENRNERTDVLTANPVHYRLTPNEPDQLKDLPAFAKTVPMVVLINESSASASELTAAALRDHGRAIIMGKNSFGKGSVQTIVSIGENEGGGAIKLTTAHYYSPSGKAINGWGVTPDVEVDQYANGDPNELLNYRELDFTPGEFIVADDEGMKIIRERREKARATYLQELADRKKKGLPDPPEPKPIKFGEDSDYMLMQTVNFFQQKPIHKNTHTAPQVFVYTNKNQVSSHK